MFASNTSPLRRAKQVVLGTVGIFVLVQVLIRVLRRAAPGPMPPRLARYSPRPCARGYLAARRGSWTASETRRFRQRIASL
jgi:hypothetical protein